MQRLVQDVGGLPAYFSSVQSEKPGALFPLMPFQKFRFPDWRGTAADTALLDVAVELTAFESPFNLDGASVCNAASAMMPIGTTPAERNSQLQKATNRRLLAQLGGALKSDLFPLELVAPSSKTGKRRRGEAGGVGSGAARRKGRDRSSDLDALEATVEESRALDAEAGRDGDGADDAEGGGEGGVLARRLGGEDEDVFALLDEDGGADDEDNEGDYDLWDAGGGDRDDDDGGGDDGDGGGREAEY